MRPSKLLVAFGVFLIGGPWVYALVAMALDPHTGLDGGAFELATYLSVVTLPLGLVALMASWIRVKRS